MLPLTQPLTAVACANVNTGLAFVSTMTRTLQQLNELNLKTLQAMEEAVASKGSASEGFER